MGKYQQECDYQAMIVSQAKEIERLNEQVAMLRHFVVVIQRWADLDREDSKTVDEMLAQTQSEWLSTHDQKVRDDALEEAAEVTDQWGETISEEIRAMKGAIK